MKCSILSLSCAAMLLKNKTVHEGKGGGKPYSAGPVCGKDPEIRSRGGLAVPRARVRHLPGARGKIAEAGCFLWGERGGKEGVLLPAGGERRPPACLRPPGEKSAFSGKKRREKGENGGEGKKMWKKAGKNLWNDGKKGKTAGKSGRKGERKGNLAHVPGKTAGEGRRQRKNAAEREKRGRPGTAGKESRAEIVAFGGKSAFFGEGKVWEAREEAEKGRGRGRREKRGEPCGMTEKKEISGGSGEKRKSAAEGAEGRLGKAAEV